MSLASDMVALIDERIAAGAAAVTKTATVVTRTSATTAMVTFDGSALPVPVKVFGDVNTDEGDRVGLVRLGVDWTIVGTFTRRRSITMPDGATTGTQRGVFGASTPPELVAYGLTVAMIYYVTDKVTGKEVGYFFIGVSNSMDGGAQYRALVYGNVTYPVAGVPTSAGVTDVKTNFQQDMWSQANYTIFKDHTIWVYPGLQLQMDGDLRISNGGSFTGLSGSNTGWDNGANWQRRNGGNVAVAGDPGKGVVNYSITTAASASTVAGAPFSAEIVTTQIINHVFESGRAYGVEILGGFNPATNTTAGNFMLRQGTTAAGTLWWDYFWTPPITGGGGGVGLIPGNIGYVKRTAAGSLTSSFVLTLRTNNSNTGAHYGDASRPRGMVMRDVGQAADYPHASAV